MPLQSALELKATALRVKPTTPKSKVDERTNYVQVTRKARNRLCFIYTSVKLHMILCYASIFAI